MFGRKKIISVLSASECEQVAFYFDMATEEVACIIQYYSEKIENIRDTDPDYFEEDNFPTRKSKLEALNYCSESINHMKNMVISGVYDIKFLEQNTLIIAEYLGLIDKEVRSNGEDGIVGAQCAWGIFSVAVNVEK